MNKAQKWLILISTAFGMLIGGTVWTWNVFARPAIQVQIEATTTPIREAIEFQNFLMMVNMPDSLIKQAEQLYTSTKRLDRRLNGFKGTWSGLFPQ